MTAAPVSSSNDNSSGDITTTTSAIAAREGNEEAQKRVNTNGIRESELSHRSHRGKCGARSSYEVRSSREDACTLSIVETTCQQWA